MNLKQQVCSLELAKRLKQLGVKQESLFYWDKIDSKLSKFSLWRIGDVVSWGMEESYDDPRPNGISAFTVAELGEMLPIAIDARKAGESISSELLAIQKGTFGTGVESASLEWQVMYYDVKFFNDRKEADARAKMLIYLIESKLIPS